MLTKTQRWRMALKPWEKTWYAIQQRCASNYKKSHNYHDRGITNHLTKEDLKFLWFRDKAELLKRPSIDRIDNDGSYTLKNCKYIELSDNSRKTRNSNKAFCDYGHEMSDENTIINTGVSGKYKNCRKCTLVSKSKYNRKIRSGKERR